MDAGDIGILKAHLRAFGSGELMTKWIFNTHYYLKTFVSLR